MISKNVQLAVVSIFGLAALETQAATCSLPASPTSSAYINAYNDGRTVPPLAGPAVSSLNSRMNFGSDSPYQGSAGSCEVTGLANDNSPPETGYTLVASTNRALPSVTGGSTSIGTVADRVWRNSAGTMCYFGTKITSLTNTDHDSTTAGTQYFEVNDIARGGFSGAGAVEVGYYLVPNSNASPIYRIGRSFTSVQHRSYKYGAGSTQAERQNNGTGYLDLPTIGGSATLNINGINSPLAAGFVAPTPSTSQQDAQVNSNWVDFTSDAAYVDDDGGTNALSAMTYVKAPCNSTSPSTWVQTGAIRVRQTAQENTNFKEISISGYAPPGATLP